MAEPFIGSGVKANNNKKGKRKMPITLLTIKTINI
jgi:hypothetical protein